MRGWYVVLVAVVWISAIVHGKPDPIGAQLEVAEQALGVVDQGVDLATKVDGILQDKLDSHFDAVKEAPPNLIEPDAVGQIAENMKSGTDIEFNEMSGFDGIKEYRPAGWKIVAHSNEPDEEPEAEKYEGAFMYPMGVGNLLMSGCFGTGYQENDPCYNLAIPLDRCVNQIDAANFIGVGFDVTKSYTSESRKKSVVQRSCANQAKFADGDVPDNMNAFGIYDYKIGTTSFQSVDGYRAYLANKAGTSMSAGTFAEISEKFETASSYGSAGLFWNAGGGKGSGSSNSKQIGLQYTNSLQQQSQSQSTGTSNNLLAILEAEIIMYEIALDHSGPSDLSEPFLKDFFKLPTSYYHIGADIKLQDFILRYGTHYVKSAKFGGKLNVFKKVVKDSKMTSSEFAKAADTEFSAMMSTLNNAYTQTHAKVGIFGFGGQHSSKGQSAAAAKAERTKNQRSEDNAGREASKTSESIETTVEALGGKPEIAAAIMDFYTPAFRSQFIEWLGTISDYPKPFDMTFGRISELFDINVDDMFNEGEPVAGCLDEHLLKTADGREYFIQSTTTNAGNKTFTTKKKVFCGEANSNKARFVADFKAKRLALERAITIYMSEGPFSTSTFELKAGKKGCEMETLDYVTESITDPETWPSWTSMKDNEFKVVFRLSRSIPELKSDQEFNVKYHDGDWYFRVPGNHYSIDNSCTAPEGSKDTDHRICVAGIILQYIPEKGLFKFDQRYYKQQHTYLANVTKSFGDHYIAVCKPDNVLTNLKQGKLGEVPCNVKWTNSHRIDPNADHSCIHFSAASKGDLFVLFSSIPKDHSTWIYLQISPSGVAFYQRMVLQKNEVGRSIGMLGDKALFETFFVCVGQEVGKNIRVSYGKAANEREVGLELSVFEFQHTDKERLSFYTFGSGEDEVTIDDVRVVKERPIIECSGDLVKKGEFCYTDCDEECGDTCIQPQDPRSCLGKCRHVKLYDNNDQKDKFICLPKCPYGMEPIKNKNGNEICTPCQIGYYRGASNYKIGTTAGTSKCPDGYALLTDQKECEVEAKKFMSKFDFHYEFQWYDPAPCKSFDTPGCLIDGDQDVVFYQTCSTHSSALFPICKSIVPRMCQPCPPGTKCPAIGLTHPTKCPKNTYTETEKSTTCKPCPGDRKSQPGSSTCENNCLGGFYMEPAWPKCKPCPKGSISKDKADKCTPCPKGTVADIDQCVDINECNNTGNNPCANNQPCVNTYGSYNCKCTGFTGKHCEEEVDECHNRIDACSHHGECKNTVGSFSCNCSTGWSGKVCDIDVDECASKPCQDAPDEDAKCINLPGSYSCKCPFGWEGKHCEKDMGQCATNNGGCPENSTCINGNSGFHCACNQGYKLNLGGWCTKCSASITFFKDGIYEAKFYDTDIQKIPTVLGIPSRYKPAPGCCLTIYNDHNFNGDMGRRCEYWSRMSAPAKSFKIDSFVNPKLQPFQPYNATADQVLRYPYWRSDGRCGRKFIKKGKPGECDPQILEDKKGPCCSADGLCGFSEDHCDCKECVNYRLKNVPWRSDGLCGKDYPKDGEPGQCDPTKSGYKLGPCCSSNSVCGDSADHCLCKGCINYNRDENVFRDDGKCGEKYLINGKAGQCDPTKWGVNKGPCCSEEGVCSNKDKDCSCEKCKDYRLKVIRDDGKCGYRNTINGKPGQCDPTKSEDKKGPCCSLGGWCGNSKVHCCRVCSDFRRHSSIDELNGY